MERSGPLAHFSINPSYHEPILRRGMGRLARAYLALHMSLMAAIPGTVCQGASEFYRGINCNGPELMIDGHAWESGHKAQNFSTSGKSFENQSVKLHPITDPSRSTMLRSSYWGSKVDLNLEAVPDGPVQIFLYVWEDNHSEQFDLRVNGKTVIHKFHSGSAGQWKKLGPWLTQADQGRIQITAQGPGHGAANLSGLEIWMGEDPIPDPNLKRFVANPSPDQVEFFEKRVRGILAEHCYECHSSQAREIKGGLVLDSRIGVMAGGASGPVIIPGDPDSSPLIHAIRKIDADFSMPPKTTLSEFEIGALMEWVEMGAPDPRMEDTVALARKKSTIDWEEARQWWSFQPIRNPQAPAVENGDWPTSPIDRFLLAEWRKNGLTPAPDVEKSTLLRRLSYDLTGLPPSPEDIEAFLRDPSEDAYHAYVEKLLASPHYGERWGRHWLDVVRYADTAGDNSDFPIPQHFLYRNWVIDALNRDYPYDLFIRDQIAGDLVTSENQTDKFQRTIATGYIANARRFGSRVDDYPQHLTIEDTIDNLGKSFLGLTVQCARCHDHKFDPISIDDYYGLFGIFHSTRYPWPGIELDQKQRDLVPLASPQEWTQAQNHRNDEINRLEQTIKKLENDLKSASESQKPELNQALREAGKSRDQLKKRPLPLPMAYAVAEAPVIENVPVQLKGDPARPDRLVPRRFLSILGGEKVPEAEGRSGRLHLAHWLTSPTNPLTARVMVNR
ncbi:MAG: PSD1 and planctomycete cytochrome C domain-containing protein, partial [Verrucomicrobia bacterium]|nr:PSD1 and planctomycete cytochrome C domain-containing protein [Verrucomicrobiota bacterium]